MTGLQHDVWLWGAEHPGNSELFLDQMGCVCSKKAGNFKCNWPISANVSWSSATLHSFIQDEPVGARLNHRPSSIATIEPAMAVICEDSKSTSHRKAPIASLFITSEWIGPHCDGRRVMTVHSNIIQLDSAWHDHRPAVLIKTPRWEIQGCGTCGKPVVDVMFPMRMSSRMRSGCHRRKICFQENWAFQGRISEQTNMISFLNPGPHEEAKQLCVNISYICST